MIQIHDPAQCSAMVMAQMKRGVVTNNVLTATQYQQECDQGTLYAHEFDGGLVMLRHRDTHVIANFHLQQGATLQVPPMDKPVVVELVQRPNRPVVDGIDWQGLGFVPTIHRQRLSMALPEGCETEAAVATLAHQEDLMGLLHHSYTPITACLPTPKQLQCAIEAGEFLVLYHQGRLIGLLHFQTQGKTSEIRHLALAEDMRGQGHVKELILRYFQMCQGKKGLVWSDKKGIIALYGRHGYQPDGYQSTIYIRKGSTP